MRIGVVNTWRPFVSGGAEYLAVALCRKLEEHGHEAMLVKVPLRWDSPEVVVESALAARLLDMSRFERVITLKFPAYLVNHPRKSLWLLHQFRQAYDLWGTPFQDLPDTAAGRRAREIVVQADNEAFSRIPRIFTNSQVTSDRLRRFNGFESSVLLPPLAEPERFFCSGYQDFLFCPGRITGGKRQALAVEAMRYVRTPVRLVVAGLPETAEDLARLETIVSDHGLGSRVEIIDRFITEEEKADLHGRSLGCVYLPYDEDSYGYVTLEAFQSQKPVLTCWDSGGLLSLVTDEVSGIVVPPQPQDLAAAIDRLGSDRDLARRLGEGGHRRLQELKIDWAHVISELLR